MQSLSRFLALGVMLSLTLSINATSHDQLFSRQTADCLPLFLEYPSDLFVPCGDLYISNLCTCCSGDVLGCYTSLNVCSTDSYGDSICCPASNPECAIEAVSPATSAAPSIPTSTQVYESSPTTTAQDYTSAAVTTPPLTTPVTTQDYPSSPTSSSQSVTNPDFPFGEGSSTSTSASPAATSSVTRSGSGGPPSNFCGQWEFLAMLFVFQFI